MIVTSRDIAACKMCASGARRFMREVGLTQEQVNDFYRNGMELEKFEQLFGHDIMAKQVIDRVKNGER